MKIKKLGRWLIVLILAVMTIGGYIMMNINDYKDYPNHPITLIVPSGAGSGGDLQCRTLEKFLSQRLGQTVIVTNKPGSGGVNGCNEMVLSKADGYTLGQVDVGKVLQCIYGKTKYDYLSALDPLAQFSESPELVAVNADAPWRDMREFIAYAKAHPGTLKYGHSGLGSTPHIIGAGIAAKTGIEWDGVPFNGGGEGMAALLGGHVHAILTNPAVCKEQMKAGKIRILAACGEARMKDPDYAAVPTLKEQGVDFALTTWRNIVAHKPLPPKVKAKLETALKEAIHDPEFIAMMENMGFEVNYLDSEQCVDKWIAESRRLTKLLKETGVMEQVQAQKQ